MTHKSQTTIEAAGAERPGVDTRPDDASRAVSIVSLTTALDYARTTSTALRSAARKARAPSLIVSGGGGFKARRGDRLFIRSIIFSFFLLVVIPLVAASIYLPFIAADQFASEARFAVRSNKSSPVSALMALGSGGGRQMQDSQIIANFLQSRAVVDEIEAKFDLRAIFAPRGYDFLFGFSAEDPKERLVRYWRRQVSVNLDRSTAIMSVEVRAFQANDALAICTALVEISERMVNELTMRARKDALGFAERELKRNEKLLEQAMLKLRDIQNQEGVLDVDAQAFATNEVISKLELSLAKLEQEIGVMAPQLSPEAPQLRYMTAQAKALRARIAEFRRTIASDRPNGGTASLSSSANLLDRQKTEAKIAVEQYALSISSFEAARAELETQGSFLITFLKPRLSEEAEFPKRWFLWALVVVPALILWAFILGIGLLIRDNMPS